MGETLEQRAERIAADLESRDMEAAEVLRALVRRELSPATADILKILKAIVRDGEWNKAATLAAREFIAEREPTPPALPVRGDSRTDDAGRWSGLESGVDT